MGMGLDQNWFLETISGSSKSIAAAITRSFLFPLSIFYRLAIGIRNWAYDNGWKRIHTAGVPVISVGNLTTGGTGKTPFVIWLANRLQSDHSVTVISRGYGSHGNELNDEGREIKSLCPQVDQIQDPNRVAAASRVTADNHSLIILDDGFQHRRLHRDLDIVLIDALNPFGFDQLLPRGLLREPLSSIRRCNLVVLTRANLVPATTRQQIRNTLSRHCPDLVWAETTLEATGWRDLSGQHHGLMTLNETNLFSFSAIGNPSGFDQTLRQQGLNVVGCCTFNDHHQYTQQDLATVHERAVQADAAALVCTLKDLVKIRLDWQTGLPIFALTTGLTIVDGIEQIERALDGALSELKDTGRDKPSKSLAHR